jgi:hypothetical protein
MIKDCSSRKSVFDRGETNREGSVKKSGPKTTAMSHIPEVQVRDLQGDECQRLSPGQSTKQPRDVEECARWTEEPKAVQKNVKLSVSACNESVVQGGNLR